MTSSLPKQNIGDKDYQVVYEPETQTVTFDGVLSLSSTKEYAPIAELLEKVLRELSASDTAAAATPPQLTLNLATLEFLNSSGINVLSRFVIRARDAAQVQLVVQGSKTVIWQTRSLKNLQRLMPALAIEWV